MVDGWAKRTCDDNWADEVVSSTAGVAVFVWSDGDRWLAEGVSYDEVKNPAGAADAAAVQHVATPARAGKGSGKGKGKGRGKSGKGKSSRGSKGKADNGPPSTGKADNGKGED
eukprot:7080750-Pyramimonas_sp.AAC.1